MKAFGRYVIDLQIKEQKLAATVNALWPAGFPQGFPEAVSRAVRPASPSCR
jgi:hypothetical protein